MNRVRYLVFLFFLLSPVVEACARSVTDIQRLFALRQPLFQSPEQLFKLKTSAFKKVHLQPSKRKTLDQAFNQFEKTPGFIETITAFVQQKNEDSAEGHWYEIERAVALHEQHCKDGECPVIVGFNQNITTAGRTREFDIIALLKNCTHLYECKNVTWKGNARKKRCQFLDQQRIAQDLQRAHHIHCSYLLCSKQPLPLKWISWFKEHQIFAEQNQ